MKIIYHCYGGTHSSVMAASIHLGILDSRKRPSKKELLACPYFDEVDGKDSGRINFVGRDENNNEIYVMGCKGAGKIIDTFVEDLTRIMGNDAYDIVMADTKPCLNIVMKFGGFLSRRLSLLGIGRVFLYFGSRIAFEKIRTLVEQVKEGQG
ncbi:MAG: DUF3189 family protein [Bacillota bacterium]|nr:DUF3189 family protein [Bacillota bacterium]